MCIIDYDGLYLLIMQLQSKMAVPTLSVKCRSKRIWSCVSPRLSHRLVWALPQKELALCGKGPTSWEGLCVAHTVSLALSCHSVKKPVQVSGLPRRPTCSVLIKSKSVYTGANPLPNAEFWSGLWIRGRRKIDLFVGVMVSGWEILANLLYCRSARSIILRLF